MNAEGRIVTAARWISGATIVAAARGFYQAVSDEPGLAALGAVKIGGIVLVSYVLIVVAFESLIGFFQPEACGSFS